MKASLNGSTPNGNGVHSPAHPAAPHSRHARRWAGIERPYGPADVAKITGSLPIEYTLARQGAERLWQLLHERPYVPTLGAMTGNQAVQQVRARLEAIYVSGWQVAADANISGQTYPDQSLYPANSVPQLVERINRALQRADQIEHAERLERIESTGCAEMGDGLAETGPHWFAPIIADAEAGFGGPLNVFELMKGMIAAGAAGVHIEDQLASEKKCGHMGGKVLIPTQTAVRNLVAARLAADALGVPTVLLARTDANAAQLITSDIDERDRPFLTGERTSEGFFRTTGGLNAAIARGLAYAPYADLIWCETAEPSLEEARQFAAAIHAQFPGKLLAYNCSPSFNWRAKLDDETIAIFQQELGRMGYRFQFITLAGFHSLNLSMFKLARGYREHGMSAYAQLQTNEFAMEPFGYSATRHQREVGAGYFDTVAQIIAGGASSTTALAGSTEEEQFTLAAQPAAASTPELVPAFAAR